MRGDINNPRQCGIVVVESAPVDEVVVDKDISLENSFLAVENSWRIGAPLLSTRTKSSLTKSDSLCSRGSHHMTQDDENDVSSAVIVRHHCYYFFS